MTELSKLEQEIKEAFKKKGVTASRSDLAKAAAELFRKKIEQAFREYSEYRNDHEAHNGEPLEFNEWIKDNL